MDLKPYNTTQHNTTQHNTTQQQMSEQEILSAISYFQRKIDGSWVSEEGHLEIVQWLHTAPTDILEGILETTKHERTRSSFTDLIEDAIEEAAMNGHLKVIKFILQVHGENISTCDAIDMAAYHGHLEVVKWLNENRTDGFSAAIENALENEHLDIVLYLEESIKYRLTH
jgi:hypothetical protein